MSLYDAVRDLPLEVEATPSTAARSTSRAASLARRRSSASTGGGEEGLGEDVTYEATEHDAQLERGPVLPLAGEWTLDSFSQHLAAQALFENPPERDVYVDYRRWAFESAALDLALRQDGLSLGQAVGREPRPLTFVVSMRLGEPPSPERLTGWLDLYPGLRFKLDATTDWTDELVARAAGARLRRLRRLQGPLHGNGRRQGADPALYRRVIEGLPGIWLEDPALDDDTRPILEPLAPRSPGTRSSTRSRDIEALPLAAEDRERQAVAVRIGRAAVRGVRLLRGARDRRVRRRPVRARGRARPHPVPRRALPSGHAERRRARRLQSARSGARAAGEPAHGHARETGFLAL